MFYNLNTPMFAHIVKIYLIISCSFFLDKWDAIQKFRFITFKNSVYHIFIIFIFFKQKNLTCNQCLKYLGMKVPVFAWARARLLAHLLRYNLYSSNSSINFLFFLSYSLLYRQLVDYFDLIIWQYFKILLIA